MTEKIFYKFKNITDYSLDSMKNRYFYFSIPRQLNDPADCRIPICYDATDEDINNWIAHIKAQSIAQNRVPEDIELWTPEVIRQRLNNKNLDLEKAVQKTFDHFHILSLTDKNDKIEMWNHKDYCNKFSGICIGYKAYRLDEKFPYFYIETLESEREPFFQQHEGKYYIPLQKIKYDNDGKHYYYPFVENYETDLIHPLMGNTRNNNNIMYNLLNKTRKWNYENEYRGFYQDLKRNGESIVRYPDRIIESITFGKKCSLDVRNEIYNIMKSYSNFDSIKFYEAKPHCKKIKAIIKPIEKNELEKM
jgi:hypothetical protein